jgi:putative transposase
VRLKCTAVGNGRRSRHCQNQHWFASLGDARSAIKAWRVNYNDVRPHTSLGFKTPSMFAQEAA